MEAEYVAAAEATKDAIWQEEVSFISQAVTLTKFLSP